MDYGFLFSCLFYLIVTGFMLLLATHCRSRGAWTCLQGRQVHLGQALHGCKKASLSYPFSLLVQDRPPDRNESDLWEIKKLKFKIESSGV